MTLIDGVGDEVVQFLAVVIIAVVAALAWWSTNAHPDRYRTVLVMRSHAHPVNVSIRRRTNSYTEDGPRENSPVIAVQEMQEIDSIIDADVAMMSNHRMYFYRRVDLPNNPSSAAESTSDESEALEDTEPASNAQIHEMDSIVNAMEADGSTDPFPRNSEAVNRNASDIKGDHDVSSTASDKQAGEGAEQASTDSKIVIKLKYLNDTLKEVEGSLDELLLDFKCRHFSTELSSQCRVRLIYNGRVLNEGLTLRACGLQDRAVVHCLVHPTRNNTQRVGSEVGDMGSTGALGSGRPELVSAAVAPDRTWDLENVLMTLVSVALTVVWFFRCEYSNMFTASASVALFGLTVFYSVAIFGLYLSDTFHFERRQPQPVPNN